MKNLHLKSWLRLKISSLKKSQESHFMRRLILFMPLSIKNLTREILGLLFNKKAHRKVKSNIKCIMHT